MNRSERVLWLAIGISVLIIAGALVWGIVAAIEYVPK